MTLYIIAGLAALTLIVGGIQEAQVIGLKRDVAVAKTQTAEAKQALADYQAQAAEEVRKRIAENKVEEEKLKEQVNRVYLAYKTVLAPLRARYDSLLKRTQAASSSKPVPIPSADPPRVAEPSPVESADIPRCVDSSRREEFVAVLAAADEAAVKLVACQEFLRSLESR